MRSEIISDHSLLELLEGLIRTPSVNPVLAPAESAGEAAVAAYARDWLGAHGVQARLEEVVPGRPNVVAEVGSAAGATLILCGHIDTVSALGMSHSPFEPHIQGRRVYGRGAYDMKGGVASAMAATAALQAETLPGRLLLALVVDEEHSSIGADHFVAAHRGDGCIITEPTDEQLILTHKGFVWSKLTTHGVAAHGSRWDLGVSAIGKMGRVVAALERFDQTELRARSHPHLGPASLHCATIEGGAGLSTYAPDCRLNVERRTLPGETPEQVADELKRVVDETGEQAEIEVFFHRSPLVCNPDARVARSLRDAAHAVTGSAPREAGVAYWTDAAIFEAVGIPTLNYGPRGQGAHGAEEWVDLDSVVTCARVLVDAARRFFPPG